MAKSILKLDLHPIAKSSRSIDVALEEAFKKALESRIKVLEVIPGKGTGQLMKRVKRWLNQKSIKSQYQRVVVDASNHGRLFVYFCK